MSFQEIEFKEFVTLQRGFDLPKTQMKDGEVPVLGSNCVIGYHNEAKVEPPGVVTGRSGTLGAVSISMSPIGRTTHLYGSKILKIIFLHTFITNCRHFSLNVLMVGHLFQP